MDNTQKISAPTAIIIAGVLIAGGLYFGLSNRIPTAPAGPVPGQATVNIKDVKITPDNPVIGSATAPVTIAYWADYQCPFCKQFETAVLPDLLTKYVNTGKVKIVFKDYPFLGSDSTAAALYGHAVWELYPDKFLAWNEAMYKAQDQEGDQGFGNEDSIVKLIGTIQGMDAAKVKALVGQKKDAYTKAIDASRQEGATLGIQGTPGFILGTQLIAGAQPLSNFSSSIDALLAKPAGIFKF